jgi:acyl-coenzyme A thioesterase PaaI-like protein
LTLLEISAFRHLNRSHVPHGGVIATLIDTACGFAGCYSAEPGKIRGAVTLTLTTCFLGQAEAGMTLVANTRRTGGRRTVFFARCDLVDSAVDPDERAVDEDVLEIGIVRQSREQALPHALLRPPPKKANI